MPLVESSIPPSHLSSHWHGKFPHLSIMKSQFLLGKWRVFVSGKDEVKRGLLDQVGRHAEPNRSHSHVPDPDRPICQKKKGDLRWLPSSIQGEKKAMVPSQLLEYSCHKVISWKMSIRYMTKYQKSLLSKSSTLPQLSDFTRKYTVCALLDQFVLLREFSVLLAWLSA